MIDDLTLIAGRGVPATQPSGADGSAPAETATIPRSTQRPSLPFPPRLEISPLTIRRPTVRRREERLPVH